MDRAASIYGKRVVSRTETLEYAVKKFGWKDMVIGISCYYGFWAWLKARLTGQKAVYYCIDFYSPELPINKQLWRKVFVWFAMQADKFLVKHCDKIWDISERINEGRFNFGGYLGESMILPLSYPPEYFRFQDKKEVMKNSIAYVGLDPYGIELLEGIDGIELKWLGKDKLLPLKELLDKLSRCGIGISMWKEKGNNYYGDPGKTKLYSACGLPVIMTDNTPYAKIINGTKAGLVIKYDGESLRKAIKNIVDNYSFYKDNVQKTWRYINTDYVCAGIN